MHKYYNIVDMKCFIGIIYSKRTEMLFIKCKNMYRGERYEMLCERLSQATVCEKQLGKFKRNLVVFL